MKHGDTVAVCYDGKYSRRVAGLVVKGRKGHHVLVRFNLEGETVEAWFRARRRGKRKYYAGWLRHDDAFMPLLFPQVPGDYFAVYKWRHHQ